MHSRPPSSPHRPLFAGAEPADANGVFPPKPDFADTLAIASRERSTPNERNTLFVDLGVEARAVRLAPGSDGIGVAPMRTVVYMRALSTNSERMSCVLRRLASVRDFSALRLSDIAGLHCNLENSGLALALLPALITLIMRCRQAVVDRIVSIEDLDRSIGGNALQHLFDVAERHDIVVWNLKAGRLLTREIFQFKTLMAMTKIVKKDLMRLARRTRRLPHRPEPTPRRRRK